MNSRRLFQILWNSVVKDGAIDLSEVGLSEEEIKEISQIYIVACGSAYHVGVAAQYVMEDLARIPVRVELASEFRYRNPILDPKGTGYYHQSVRRDCRQSCSPQNLRNRV